MKKVLLLVLAAAALATAAQAKPARRKAPAAPDATPAIRLLESRPLGTRLGNPELQETAAGWIQELRRARSRVDIEAFYIADWPKEALRPVLEEIARAGRRGVQVRILVDSRALRAYPEPIDSLRGLENITAERVNFGLYTGGLLAGRFMAIDGRTVILGSADFDWRSMAHMHELGVVIRDAGVTQVFEDLFDMDWRMSAVHVGYLAVRDSCRTHRAAVYSVKSRGEAVEVRPGYTPPGWLPDSTLWDQANVLRAIHGARHEIVLQLLNYSPTVGGLEDSSMDKELRAAAARGVRVKLLVSDWNLEHPGIDALQSLVGLPNLDVRLSVVPEWSGGYITAARVEHCSYMVVDTATTWIGTSNFEPGHFLTARNEGVTLASAFLSWQARTVFENSWSSDVAQPVDKTRDYVARPRGLPPPPGVKVYAAQ